MTVHHGDITDMISGGVGSTDLLQTVLRGLARQPLFLSLLQATASQIAAEHQTIRILARGDVTQGEDQPLRGGFTLRRVAAAPGHGFGVRTADRFLPDGSVDPANGGWWDFPVGVDVTAEMLGAKGATVIDGEVADDTVAIRNALSLATALRVGLRLSHPDGYAISGPLTIQATVEIYGAGGSRPTLHALTTDARIEIGRASEVRLHEVNYSGVHPVTGVTIGFHAFVALERGGRATGLQGPNKLTLDNCRSSDTRGAAVVLGRDATEFRVIRGSYVRAGRVVSQTSPGVEATGPARFPDGHTPLFSIQSNGILEGVEMGGATGYCIEVSGGPDDSFGVWEEVLVRAVNVRAQNGFLGILRVRDWIGAGARTSGTASPRPVNVTWHSGYAENPGTVQDITTSGGSDVTQKTDDTVHLVLAQGPGTRVALSGPTKWTSRRANGIIVAEQGAQIHAQLSGVELRVQEALSSGARMFSADDDSEIVIESMLQFRSELNVRGAIAETGAGPRQMLTAVLDQPISALTPRIRFPSARTIMVLADGTSTAHFTSINGVTSTALSTTAADLYEGNPARSALVVTMRTDNTTPRFVRRRTVLPESCRNRWVLVQSRVHYQQIGAALGGAGVPVQHALRVIADSAQIQTASEFSGSITPPAPGAGAYTDMIEAQHLFWCDAPGTIDLDVFASTMNAPADDRMLVHRLEIAVIDGGGAGA